MLGILHAFALLFVPAVLSIDPALWNIDTSSRRFAYNAASRFDTESVRRTVYEFERGRSIEHTLPDAHLFPSHEIPEYFKQSVIYAPASYEIRPANLALLVGSSGGGSSGGDTSIHNLRLDYPAYISTGGTLGFTQDEQSFRDMDGMEVVVFRTNRALQIRQPKQLPADYASSTKNVSFIQSFYPHVPDVTAPSPNLQANSPQLSNTSGYVLTSFRMNLFANFHPTKLQDIRTGAMVPRFKPLFPLIFKATVEACLTTFKATIRGGRMAVDNALNKLSIFFPNAKVMRLTIGSKRFVHKLIPPFHAFRAGQPIFLYRDPAAPELPALPFQYHKAGAVICYHVKDDQHEQDVCVASILEFDSSFPPVKNAEKTLKDMIASFAVPAVADHLNQPPISPFEELMIASAMTRDLFGDLA